MTGVELLHITTDDESYKLTGDTVVIGGGNVAIDVSRTAIRCGSPKVSQVSLETRDIMPALPEEIETAESEGINIIGGWGPKEILTEDGKVTGIVFKKCTSVKDADGRFNPQYDENETMTIECSNVIMSVGQAIEWGSLLEGTKVEFWHGNYPVADKVTYQTAEPDIFVGGDVYTGPKFAIDAIAAGKQGAISIHRYVQPHSSLTIGRILTIMLNLIRMITALRSMTIQAVSAQLRSQELISCHSEVMQVYSQRNRLRKKLQDAWAVVQQSLMRTSA